MKADPGKTLRIACSSAYLALESHSEWRAIPMSDDQDKKRSAEDAQLEREIRHGRKFTAREAMGRMLGPGAMKGGSAVSRVQQAETEIGTWLRRNLTDQTGALQVVLHRLLKESRGCLTTLINRSLLWRSTANRFSPRIIT